MDVDQEDITSNASRHGHMPSDPLHPLPPLSSATDAPANTLHTVPKDWSPEGEWHLQRVLRGHNNIVWTIAFSPDGKLVVSGSSDKTIRVWDVESGRTVLGPLGGHNDWVRWVVFSPDGNRIASGSDDKTVIIWDAHTGGQLLQFRGQSGRFWDLAFSPDGTRVASIDFTDRILLWSVDSGTIIRELQKPKANVRRIRFSKCGRFILALMWVYRNHNNDSTYAICAWDVESGELVLNPSDELLGSGPPWSHSGSVLMYRDGVLRKWSGSRWMGAISPDGQCIVSLRDDEILLYSRDLSPQDMSFAHDIVERHHKMCVFYLSSRMLILVESNSDSVFSIGQSLKKKRFTKSSSTKGVGSSKERKARIWFDVVEIEIGWGGVGLGHSLVTVRCLHEARKVIRYCLSTLSRISRRSATYNYMVAE